MIRIFACAVAFFACGSVASYGAVVAGGPTRYAQAPPPAIARDEPLRIMALGDSITAGIGPSAPVGGYRRSLQTRLEDAGYRTTFVGTRTDFSADLAQRAHEGWPGYVIRSFLSEPGVGQLYGPVTQRALATCHPDVVLLMAGTNDLLRHELGYSGYSIGAIEHSLYLLVDQIVTAEPQVHLIIAPVVASPKIARCDLARFAGSDVCGQPRDPESVAGVVASFSARGFGVTEAADMATAVPADLAHFPDRLHPSGSDGYRAISNVWMHAIDALASTPPVARLTRPAVPRAPRTNRIGRVARARVVRRSGS